MKRISNLTRMTTVVGYENSHGFVSYEKACEILEACLDTLQKFNITHDKCPAAHDSIKFLRHGFGVAADVKARFGASRVIQYVNGEKVMSGLGQRMLEMLVKSIDDYINSNQQRAGNGYCKQETQKDARVKKDWKQLGQV